MSQQSTTHFRSDDLDDTELVEAKLTHQNPTISLGDDDQVQVSDPRHRQRIELMQVLFAYSFSEQTERKQEFITLNPAIQNIAHDLSKIDQEISTHAPERPLAEINRVDLAILRLSIAESKTSQTPIKVILDEAIQLGKEFGTESSPKFINGVLANVFGLENEDNSTSN